MDSASLLLGAGARRFRSSHVLGLATVGILIERVWRPSWRATISRPLPIPIDFATLPPSGRRRPRGAGPGDEELGYAAVDALVAMMILASTFICAVPATFGSWRIAAAALELRRANSLSVYLLEAEPDARGADAGELDGFSWRREVGEPTSTFGAGGVCERTVTLTSQKTSRIFVTKANAVCQIVLPP